MKDRPNLVSFQIAQTFQKRIGHETAQDACMNPNDHTGAGKGLERRVGGFGREIMRLLLAVLRGIAKPRAQDVSALAADRHQPVVALASDIAVPAAARLM